jgi:hypothetical protein
MPANDGDPFSRRQVVGNISLGLAASVAPVTA